MKIKRPIAVPIIIGFLPILSAILAKRTMHVVSTIYPITTANETTFEGTPITVSR